MIRVNDCLNDELEKTENEGSSLVEPCIFRWTLHRSRKGRAESPPEKQNDFAVRFQRTLQLPRSLVFQAKT